MTTIAANSGSLLTQDMYSIRGFISGTVAKKMGVNVESVKDDVGERTYRITP
jgi:hypothetical protein